MQGGRAGRAASEGAEERRQYSLRDRSRMVPMTLQQQEQLRRMLGLDEKRDRWGRGRLRVRT